VNFIVIYCGLKNAVIAGRSDSYFGSLHLGIPTMRDRAKQALLKLALEPEWEAKFETNSQGFRPGRSTHDAIEAIRIVISGKPKYVLDADIAQCFDRIDHQKLLKKIDTIPQFRRQIKAWLKAGVIEKNVFHSTDSGTPQGGVCVLRSAQW